MDTRQLLIERAATHPDKPAIIFKEQEISFLQLKEHAARWANLLAPLGAGPGQKIAFYLPNCPEYVYCYLACFCLGAVAVPLDFMLKEDELVSCLDHSGTRILVTLPKADISLAVITARTAALKHVVVLGEEVVPGTVRAEALLAGVSAELPDLSVDESAPAMIMYTSGTTGNPKGILLNYKHLDGSPRAMEHFVDLTGRDVKLVAIPFSHIGGFIFIQNGLIFGITLVVMDRFHPYDFLKNVERYRVTCFHIVPAMYTALLTLKKIDHFDLTSLRWVVVFGAPSTPEILERFHKYCPNAKLLNGWGMTETCPPNTVTPMGSPNIASVGKPSPFCEIRIVDDAGAEVPAGQVGEITIRGWTVMAGYYKDPQLTAQVKRDGWLFTGDLGRFDGDGFLYIAGRKKEMIKVAGQIVYGPEVEAAFYKHPDVAETAVVGVPDPLRGECVKAFVVLKEGASVSAEDLKFFAKEHLAHFKVPQEIACVAQLPKNRTGKIDKEALKAA